MGRRPFVDVEVVRVAEVGPEELRRSAPVPSGSGPVILVAHEVVGVHQVELPGEPAYGDLRVDPHLHLAGAGGLGGYDDDAVAASRAVDGGQGRILQDVDGRDVGRRDIVDVVRLEAVNDIKRLVALGYRGAAAHADVDVRAGGSVNRGHLHAGHLALEGHGCGGDGHGRQFGPGDGTHGAGEVAAGHDASITYYYSVFEELGVFFKHEVYGFLARAEGYLLRGVTDTRRYESGFCGSGKRPVAIDIRHRAVGGALYGDRGSDDGFSLGILDCSRDFLLCERRSSRQKERKKCERSCSKVFFNHRKTDLLNCGCPYRSV